MSKSNPIQKGDVVTIGRAKQKFRVLHVPTSGEGAVLVETVDAETYETTYVSAAQLQRAGKGSASSTSSDD